MPFENASEDRSLYWVGEAIAEGLTREILLAGGAALEREDRESVRTDMGVPTLSVMTLASQIQAADEMGAAVLVTGRFGSTEQTLTVSARVIDVAAGRTGGWIEVGGSSRDILALQRDLLRALRPHLPLHGARPASAVSPEDGVPQAAYETLIKSHLEDFPETREKLLRRTIEIAPGYLRARIELAELYRSAGKLEKAAETLSNLATTDASLAAAAQNLLAEIEMDLGHSERAEDSLRRSLSLRDTARAHLLLARLALQRGDVQTASREADRARSLDPLESDLADIEDALAAPR